MLQLSRLARGRGNGPATRVASAFAEQKATISQQTHSRRAAGDAGQFAGQGLEIDARQS
jgi:hypothetical protein